MLLISLLFVKCSKTDLTTQEQSKDYRSESAPIFSTPTVNYYFNGQIVQAAAIDFEDSTLNILISKSDGEQVSIYAYTTENDYIKKGNELGLNLTLQLKIEKDLSNYADSIGAIALYDNTGVVDAAYTAFETSYLANIPQIEAMLINKSSIGGVWFDDIWSGTKPSTIYPSVSALMWFGAWQNRVSSFVPLFFYGTDIIYNKTFFRRRMATITGWGSQTISFNWPWLSSLNNKSKSWLSFGF